MPNPLCELCKCGTDLEKQTAGYYLCQTCKQKVAARLSSKVVSSKAPEPVYLIDRQELQELRYDGLLPIKTYVFLALKLDHPEGAHGVKVGEFCRRWDIASHELLAAIAALQKKGIIVMSTEDLQLQALSRKERIANLEKAAEA